METRRYFDNANERVYNRIYSHPKFNEFQRESIEDLESEVVAREKKRKEDEEFKKLEQEVEEFIRKRIVNAGRH